MSESAGAEEEQSCGAHQPPAAALRLQLRPPARRPLLLRPKAAGAEGGGDSGGGGRGHSYATPPAPPRPNRLLPGCTLTGLAGVVVRADRPRGPPPRPVSDRITWKHETRLRPPVAELSGAPNRHGRPEGRRPGEACLAAAESACAGRPTLFGSAPPACAPARLEGEGCQQPEVFRCVVWRERVGKPPRLG